MTQPTTERPCGTSHRGADDEYPTIRIDGDVFETLSLSRTSDDDDASRVERWLETWSGGLP